MAIMNVRMLGIIDRELVIQRAENGDIISGSFVIRVLEGTERVPFTVYSDNDQLFHTIEQDIAQGTVVLVSGIIDIKFQNNPQGSSPIITSNMTIISDDIHIMYGRKDIDSAAKDKQTTPFVAQNQSEPFFTFDSNIELPF